MATSARASASVSSRSKAAGAVGQYFYFFMSLLIAGVVIYGFSHTIGPNLIHGNPPRPWLLWVHATLFSGWVAFFIVQSGLVRTHNVGIHRALGWFGAGLAAAMTVIGTVTAIVMRRFHMRVEPPDVAGPSTTLIMSFFDIASFAVFVWLAVSWRRKPELHRRLMLIATISLTAAAFARMPNATFANVWFYSGVDALIVLGVLRDLLVMKRVHRVYWYALPVLVPMQVFVTRMMLSPAAWWVRVANAIVR